MSAYDPEEEAIRQNFGPGPDARPRRGGYLHEPPVPPAWLMIGIERVILKHLPEPDEKHAYYLAERWQACGFTAEEADAWLTAGSRVEPGTATKLKAVGVTPREAFEPLWRGHKITSDTLYSLVAENRVDLKEAGKFAEERRTRRRAG